MDQQIKSLIILSKVRSIYPKLDQQINTTMDQIIYMNRYKIYVLKVQFRCSLYVVQKNEWIESKRLLNLSVELVRQIKVTSTHQKLRSTAT